MSHIPDYLILRKIKTQMECHRKLYHTQIGSQMSSTPADLLYKKMPDLFCQCVIFFRWYLFDIPYLIDLFQHHIESLYFSLYTRDFISSVRNTFL